MKIPSVIVLILATVLTVNCKEEKASESSGQMKKVMAIHDEVMPKMGTLGRLVKELKPLVDSTDTGKAHGKAMNDLQASHKSMMNWMDLI